MGIQAEGSNLIRGFAVAGNRITPSTSDNITLTIDDSITVNQHGQHFSNFLYLPLLDPSVFWLLNYLASPRKLIAFRFDGSRVPSLDDTLESSGLVIHVHADEERSGYWFIPYTGSGTHNLPWHGLTINPATPAKPPTDPRPLYNICKRVYLLKHRSEAEAETKPIIVRKNTDGSLVPIDIDISSVLSDDINPLKRSNTVKWSDISHDRKSKIILSTFDTDPQIGDIKHASKLIVLSVGGGTPPVSGEFSKSSFINGTKTRNANELAFIDEVEKKIYLLNSSDDTWKDGSFDLYKKDKITTDISDSLRNEILSASRNHPLGEKYLKNGVATDNPLYAYDEYQGGVNNNLFPRYINNYSMAVEVGEFRAGIWRYEEDTFVFNAFKNSRDFQSDRSHNSSLYNKGRTIQFMYTPTFNASALRTISEGGPWRAITSKLSTSNRHELLAYNSDGMIDWFRWTGTSVEKARTLPLKGFNLQYVTGIEWIGNNLYVCDSGQRDNQIQKFSISTTDIQFVKTINNPVRADSLTLAQLCRVIEQQTTTTEEVCTKIPGGSRNVSSDWYSGILPIDELPVGISGRNLSLRIKINHNQYLDIGTLFLESSRPRTLK